MPPLQVTWICMRVITYHMCCLFTSLWVFPTVSMWETGFYLNSSILWSGTCKSAKGAKGHDLSWVLSSCSWWGDVISADPWPSSPAADFYLRCVLVMKCHVTTLILSGFSLFLWLVLLKHICRLRSGLMCRGACFCHSWVQQWQCCIPNSCSMYISILLFEDF